ASCRRPGGGPAPASGLATGARRGLRDAGGWTAGPGSSVGGPVPDTTPGSLECTLDRRESVAARDAVRNLALPKPVEVPLPPEELFRAPDLHHPPLVED